MRLAVMEGDRYAYQDVETAHSPTRLRTVSNPVQA